MDGWMEWFGKMGNYISPYAQSALPAPAASRALSASCRWLVGAPILVARIVSLCLPEGGFSHTLR